MIKKQSRRKETEKSFSLIETKWKKKIGLAMRSRPERREGDPHRAGAGPSEAPESPQLVGGDGGEYLNEWRSVAPIRQTADGRPQKNAEF
jgi:hypothetical protein